MVVLTIQNSRGRYAVSGDRIRGRQNDRGRDIFTGRATFEEAGSARTYARSIQRKVASYERVIILDETS